MPRKRKRKEASAPRGDEERIATLLRNKYSKEFEGLTPYEKQLAIQSLQEIRSKGASETLNAMWEIDYLQRPVTIEQFLEDDYYLGGALTEELFPKWREELEFVLSTGSSVHEWIFGGAIGTGKTTVASIAFTYLVYKMSCLRDPHAFYGLMKGSTIVFGIYSITKTQAYDSSYSKIQSFIDSSPYFKENFPRVPHIKSKIVFKRGVLQIIAGSRELHALGLDLFAFLLDEANFLKESGNRSGGEDSLTMAYRIYNAARTRLKSRFMQTGGTVPGMVFLISSKKTHSSFLEKHLGEVRDDVKEGRVHVSQYAQWDVRAERLYKMPKFRVEIGDQIFPSRILEEGVEAREGTDVLEVPGEYREEFVRDIDQALRDIAGIATYGICPLMHNKKAVKNCVVKDLEHPFVREVITLDERSDISLDEYFIPEKLFLVRRSQYTPLRDFAAPRFVHVDLGLTGDCAGLAMSHAGRFKEVRRMRGDGTFYIDRCPVIVVDFMLRILPPRGSEIDFSKIRAFLISVRDMGMPIIKVTADGFQSRDFIQIMRKIGFESQVYSVDRTDEPYLYLRQAMTEVRIEYYDYRPFYEEVVELERDIDRRKVDHPDISSLTGLPGSKDVSDAVTGSVANCIIDPRSSQSGVGQEVKETQRPTAGGYTVSAVSSKAGIADWDSLEEQARS